jgi:RNA polymerase sigma-70 factor, ECF subfamily
MPDPPQVGPSEAARLWADHRRHAFALAYRMLGSVSDADDVLQEAYLRLERTDVGRIDEPGAWLSRVVSRLCIDHLRSARVRRERYVGPWLPEPLVGGAVEPVDTVELAESLSTAFLIVLERLSPAQRVAFILHDVFGEDYASIARALGRTEVACRLLVARGRAAAREGRRRHEGDPRLGHAVATAFQAACVDGDTGQLLELLAPDVVVLADGGGLVSSARRPVHGADRAVRLLRGVFRKRGLPEAVASVNGAPGLAITGDDGRPTWVMSVTIDAGKVAALHIVTNPQKLTHLTAVPVELDPGTPA